MVFSQVESETVAQISLVLFQGVDTDGVPSPLTCDTLA